MPPPILILDSNLLVLFIVGVTDRALIGRHKRLKAFSVEDFDLLSAVIARAPSVLVTPNGLTETSNLLRQIDEPAKGRLIETFRTVVLKVGEEYITSRSAVAVREFARLGLTDAGLLEAMRETHLLLTADLDLYLAATQRGREAVNFNHLRLQG